MVLVVVRSELSFVTSLLTLLGMFLPCVATRSNVRRKVAIWKKRCILEDEGR